MSFSECHASDGDGCGDEATTKGVDPFFRRVKAEVLARLGEDENDSEGSTARARAEHTLQVAELNLSPAPVCRVISQGQGRRTVGICSCSESLRFAPPARARARRRTITH